MRRGVTLLITLSVIAAMGSLIALLYGYIEHTRQKAADQSALLQASLLKNDLKMLLSKYLNSKNLSTFYTIPLTINSQEAGYSAQLYCRPLLSTIPIEWLGSKVKKTHPPFYRLAKEILENLIDSSELKEPNRLFDMILESLLTDEVRGEGKWLKERGDALSFRRFEELLDRYRFEADDPKVEDIRWRNYFNFTPIGDVMKLERDSLTPELLAYFYGLDADEVKRERSEGNLKALLDEYADTNKRYDWLFAKGLSPVMHCDVIFGYQEREYHLGFDYLNKRVENFDFYR